MLDFSKAKNTEVGKIVLSSQEYEPEIFNLLFKLLQANSEKRRLFVDVGANIGFFPLNVAYYTQKHNLEVDIYGFEPLPYLFNIASDLMKLNDLKYKLYDQAVSDSLGDAKFYVSSRSDSSNSLNPTFRKPKDIISVNVTTLDIFYENVLRQHDYFSAILMIDVESFEPNVIRGA